MNITFFIFLVFLALIILALLGVLVWLLMKKKDMGKESTMDAVLLLQKELQHLSRTVDEKLGESTRSMHESVRHQFSESQKLIQSVNAEMTRHLGEVTKSVAESTETSKQVLSITDQLKNLEKVLTHQKQRGALGEASLRLVLENLLPANAFELQYHFKNGDAVDAVIKTKDGLIPVDAKFSLDNYNRVISEKDTAARETLEKDFKNDLKKRIDETAKYIRPEEGTLPFAFMFIPAEGIYYDLLVNEVGSVKVNTRSLIDYAYRDKNVVIVSPTTFAAYLQSVLYGFRAFHIEESAKEMGKRVEELGRHLKSYDDYFKKIGASLNTTVNHYSAAQKELGKIDKDVFRITGAKSDLEQLPMEKVVSD